MSKIDSTVLEIWGHKTVKGEIGLEIEVEGRNLLKHGIDPFWHHHRDHSLRGEDNAEYVLSKPISRKQVPEALALLFKTLEGAGSKVRKDSPNTSVHVHLNVQAWTLKKVICLITLWHIFEHLLVDWCGEERAGNVFCLRGSDAEVGIKRLCDAIRYGKFQYFNDQEGLRYTACNYTGIGKFGSVEFRSLAGVYDEDVIQKWVDLLCNLKDFSEGFENPSDIIIEFSRSTPEEFSMRALGRNWREVCRPGYEKTLREGMRFVQQLAYCIDWKKKIVQEENLRGDGWDDPVPRRNPPQVWPAPARPRWQMGPDGRLRAIEVGAPVDLDHDAEMRRIAVENIRAGFPVGLIGRLDFGGLGVPDNAEGLANFAARNNMDWNQAVEALYDNGFRNPWLNQEMENILEGQEEGNN